MDEIIPTYFPDKKNNSVVLVPEPIRNVWDKVVNQGISMKQAMLEEGYTERSASSGLVARTEGWQLLVEQCMSDQTLLSEHKKVLLQDDDLTNKMRAVETAYKIKKKYDEEQDKDIQVNIIFN